MEICVEIIDWMGGNDNFAEYNEITQQRFD